MNGLGNIRARVLPDSRSSWRRWGLAAVAALTLLLALVDVAIVEPTVHVRWREGLGGAERGALEAQYQLTEGVHVEGTTWRYQILDRSRENIGGLVRDPAALDTGGIDRPRLEAPEREWRVSVARARALVGPTPRQLVQPQSLLLLLAGLTMLWAANRADERIRRLVACSALLAVGVLAFAFPLQQPIRMGDSETYVATRRLFEEYSGVRQLRFEAHLSHAILGGLDRGLGRTAESPRQALDLLMRGATVWFLLSGLALGMVERWSAVVLRYLGLALLAPSALLYFGYRELGYLSLNVAVFPLVVRGLRAGGQRLEAGSVLAGLGAALHGFGLVALAGAGVAAVGGGGRLAQRARYALRIAAWGTAAYLGWVAVYLIVLKLPLVPGHANAIPIRPWFVDQVSDRVNVAILSVAGAKDLFFSGWVVGVPLFGVAVSLWRSHREVTRAALLYAIPSVLCSVLFWPIQGLGVEMDLVFAAFPAVYALAWVCAHDSRRTVAAAVILASAHIAFWRIVIGTDFVNSRL